MKTAIALFSLLLGPAALQDPAPARPVEQHRWLQQLVGEWTCTFEAQMGDGQPPMKAEGRETIRALGDTWIVAEGAATMNGQPMRSILTVGYDPAKKAFVGTWIDTMQTHLWVYRGQLDAAGKVLALEAEGPSFDDPTKTATYRDAIEVVDQDHKRLTSSLRNADGTWTTFMTADYRRVKPGADDGKQDAPKQPKK